MKRLIFCLLYNDGQFVLSRNFRHQRIGDINWVMNNYNLLNVSCGVDEIAILDVGENKNPEKLAEHIRILSNSCFVPLSAGGGIKSPQIAKLYLDSGADKLILNTAFFTDPGLPKHLAELYGSQCIIASLDCKRSETGFELHSSVEHSATDNSVAEHLEQLVEAGAGEILCQSVDMDGTGMGLELELADLYLSTLDVPCIMLGGVGKAEHIVSGLSKPNVDAVCTANLLNFINDAFERARVHLIENGISLPQFSSAELEALRGRFT